MATITRETSLKISLEEPLNYEKPNRIYPFIDSEIYERKILQIECLTKGDDVKEVFDVVLDTTGIERKYEPGDTIGILPLNNNEEVNEILDILSCTDIAEQTFYFSLENEKKRKNFSHFPRKSTLRNVFREIVDIRSLPKKGFLKILSDYCSNQTDSNFLEILSQPKNSEDYLKFITTTGNSLLNILKTTSSKPPFNVILENLPPLQPRPYSISSSPLIKNKLHITFSKVKYDGNLEGVCSSYLKRTDSIKFYFRKPSFRIKNDSFPIVMIGPGTGIAPFSGFLQDLHLKNQKRDTWLFYGCRYNDRDFLYRSQIEEYLNTGYLNKLSVAFSREQSDKVYVTNLMLNESDLLYRKIVIENGALYVCGDAKNMVKDVKEAFVKCLERNGMEKSDIEVFIKERVKNGKYVEDKWL